MNKKIFFRNLMIKNTKPHQLKSNRRWNNDIKITKVT